MKKKSKAIIGGCIILIILGLASYLTYKNLNANKAFKEGVEFTSKKEYDKALDKFNLALSYKSNDKEALERKDMIEEYLNSKKLFNEDKLEDANDEINKISSNYKEIDGLNNDVEALKNEINDSVKKLNEINEIKEAINKKDYNKAQKLINNIEKEKLDENQEKQVKELKEKADSELLKIEMEKRAQEEAKRQQEEARRIAEENRQIEENKKNFNSQERAEELAKKLTAGYDSFVFAGISNVDNVLYYQFVASGASYGRATYLVPVAKSNKVYTVVSGDGGKPTLYLASC